MKKFYLEIITPEKTFYKGEVESIRITTIDGSCSILAEHQPMVFATVPGSLYISVDGQTKEAFMSEGFVEVRPDETIAFSEAAEWPEEINAMRAEEARQRAEEQLRRNRSAAEYRLNRLALQRAFARLQVKNHKNLGNF